MRKRTTPFVLVVLGAAIAVTLRLRSIDVAIQPEQTTAIVVLCTFALVADLLLFLLPQGAFGSISFIPTLCAVLVVPSWYTVAGLAMERAIAESARRADFEKAVFNIAQTTFSIGLAILVFLSLGGSGFLGAEKETIFQLTRYDGFAAFAAF